MEGEKTMQAVKGFLIDGHFTPTDDIMLPSHVHVTLIIESESRETQDTKPNNFWHEFDRLVDESTHEDMPEFPRMQFGREPIIFEED